MRPRQDIFSYSLFDSIHDTTPSRQDESWSEFAARLVHVEAARKHAVPAFAACVFRAGGVRHARDVEAVTGLVLDFDNAIPAKQGTPASRVLDPWTVEEVIALLADRRYLLYSTFSHAPEWPRFRVVLPLTEPTDPTRWSERADRAVAALGLNRKPGLDPAYRRLAQLADMPSCPVRV